MSWRHLLIHSNNFLIWVFPEGQVCIVLSTCLLNSSCFGTRYSNTARHGNAIWVNVKIAKLLKIVIPWSTVATGGNFYIHPDCITIPCHIAVPGAREPCLVTCCMVINPTGTKCVHVDSNFIYIYMWYWYAKVLTRFE